MRVLLPVLILCGCGVSGAPANLSIGAQPGAEPYPQEIADRLASAWQARPQGYQPRTKHLFEDGTPKYTNRLFLESSPYLLQHAHNPVDWHPWGQEAFEKARTLGRPLLLSVGYSTCHWCHVMEEESFEDEEVARLLNEQYIAIKVDREVRPDIDAVYMAAVQALTGGGGWPMTVWLTPEKKPFYAGTYFPPRDGERGARFGLLTLLARMREVYDTQPEDVSQNAATFQARIEEMLGPPPPGDLPSAAALESVAARYRSRFDPLHGGLQGAPKFPSSLPIRFLLREFHRSGDKQNLEMATLTLDRMAHGGIYDQIGGGFHRYSTDAEWLVPHFEKMLYDNALLVRIYLEAYQAGGREEFADLARDILRYVEREMTSPDGAFYSATDADSVNSDSGEREEGYHFTWTLDELKQAVGEKAAAQAAAYYQAAASGNFEGRNILVRPPGPAPPEIAALRERLYQARQVRPRPLRDEKILTSWNGLMISGYAFAARALAEPDYAERAGRAADFLLQNLRLDGRLQRSFKDDRAQQNAYLDDYAFLIAGLLDLYEATAEPRRLEQAIALDRQLSERYEDVQNGGFYLTSNDHETLLAREKPSYDGAEPSGNSVQALNLLRLHEFTTDDRYRQRADRLLRAFSRLLTDNPEAVSEMLPALDFRLSKAKQIILVARSAKDDLEPLLAVVRRHYIPNAIFIAATEPELASQQELIPLVEGKTAIAGRPTAYVCEERVCELPTSDPAQLAQLLGQ